MQDRPTKQRVAAAVERKGANAVAKAIGVPRSTVLSYCAGTSREGTDLLIEMRADRLDSDLPPPPSARSQ